MLSRREFVTGVSVVAVCALVGLPDLALAQRADTVPMADLAKPSPLGDMVMGSENAPVTVIEYASMT
ncbi:MAG: twin-arginine translocation signal domain-containing protein, partial [Xanthobacteraceae bacterium]